MEVFFFHEFSIKLCSVWYCAHSSYVASPQKLVDDCSLSKSFKAALSNSRINVIRQEIAKVLDDTQGGAFAKGNVNVQAQRCMAVRPGIDTVGVLIPFLSGIFWSYEGAVRRD